MLEQKQLDPRKPVGKKECAIFETSSAPACSTGTPHLRGKKTTIFHMHTALRARVQILFKSDIKNIGYYSQFCGPMNSKLDLRFPKNRVSQDILCTFLAWQEIM